MPRLASELSWNEALLRLAVLHGVEVNFKYAKGDGRIIESRRLFPAEVKRTKDGSIIVVGEDLDRDEEPRAYRLDRIRGNVAA